MSKDGQEAKRPVGRPTKYDPAFCEMAIEFMAEGYSKEALAGHLQISEDTLYEWIKVHKDFSEAIKIASKRSQLKWEKIGIDNILSTSEFDAQTKISSNKALNSSVWIFNMKNRFGWNDKKEVDLNVAPIKFKYDPNEK